ncbi:soma ferritin-like [Saccoglossus kowalevskii]|uniref:Ferritin n=1 Tax=Saccoglossus kowalevskii TaxID=10224 RepID=A0ABM0H1S0_SACKO|nr:PREDICTED: soma ferritin-like isoform X1 [Saccoglossus kowalevskii]
MKYCIFFAIVLLSCGAVLSEIQDTATPYKKSKVPLGRQNFDDESENAINDQIAMELYASHVYLTMSYHFDRDDVALPGFAKFFKKASDEEREHAEGLMGYQNRRGGRIVMKSVPQPDRDDWNTGRDAMWQSLVLEKEVNQQLLRLVNLAENKNDPHLADFITSNYLKEQVESIAEFARHISNLDRVGPGLGEYMYDKETLQ